MINVTQKEYVENCLQYYRETDLQPGDPESGDWNVCHYPIPKCLGGTETILLLKEHHAVQGLLQSEELQHPCIWGWEKQYLNDEMTILWKKWMVVKSKQGLKVAHATGHTEELKAYYRIRFAGSGNPMYGRTHTESAKQKVAESNRTRGCSQSRRDKLRERYTGKGNNMYGIPSPATGKKWWVNNEGQAVLAFEKPGDDWRPGRKWR